MSAKAVTVHSSRCRECAWYHEYETAEVAAEAVDEHNKELHRDKWWADSQQRARREAWDYGFSKACEQWTKQRQDPSHPITRNNPFK